MTDVTLDLTLAPDDLPLLLRQPALRSPGEPRRSGAGRATRLSLVWHDTPDGRLAADGLALAQSSTTTGAAWLLERMIPDTGMLCPPGGSLPSISQTPAPPAQPAPLLPVAAFDGTTRVLRNAEGQLAVVLLQGELRAVAATAPICRIRLSGPDATGTALVWSALLRLSVPRLSLPAEALTLAGRTPPARPLGAPALAADQTAGDAFAFIAAHLAGVIHHHAPAALAMQGPEPVHQMRVALRRLRSAILLFRRAVACPALDDITRQLKQLGHILGPARDWDVFTAGAGRRIGEAFPDDAAVAALRAAAERRRQESYKALAQYLASPAWRTLGIALADLALTRPWQHFTPDDPIQAERHAALQHADLAAFAARALRRRLEAVIAPGPDLAALDLPALHDIRLHAKRLRYACEFFAPLFPGRATAKFLRRMSALQEVLGLLNDTAVAASLMADLPGRGSSHHYAVGIVRGFVAASAPLGRAEIAHAWKRFLQMEPFWY